MEQEKKPEEQPVEPEQAPPSQETVQPPAPEPATPTPSPPAPRDTNTLIIIGWVFIGLSVLTCCCCSWLFGPVAAVLGGIAYSRGDQRGLLILILGIVIFFLGSGFWAVSRYTNYPAPWDRIPMHGPWRRV